MERPNIIPERVYDRIDMKQIIAGKIAELGVVRVEEPQPAAIYYFHTEEEPDGHC